MTSPETQVIFSEDPDRILAVMNAMMPSLPREIRRSLNGIKLRLFQLYGMQGLYERVNGRTVSQVVSEYNLSDDVKPTEFGQLGDVRYELFDAPASVEGIDSRRPDKTPPGAGELRGQ